MSASITSPNLAQRFRGFLPVVIDVETGGFDASIHPMLELAAIPIVMGKNGQVIQGETQHYHVTPFEGAEFDPKCMAFHQIQPDHPFRMAVSEAEALEQLSRYLHTTMKAHGCQKSVLVGHNAHFDLGFVQAAITRCALKRSPFHAFTCFDTATLSALVFGETVLAKALQAAGIAYSASEAHSALYDTEKTAELFCTIVNTWQKKS